MVSILSTLAARYEVPVEVGVRQDSGLNPSQVGEPDLEAMDKYVLRRLTAAADRLTGILNVAAGRYSWPFSATHLAQAYPYQDAPTRENTLRIQLETAADAVYKYVLGDLFGRAAPRDERYAEQRNFYVGDPNDRADIGDAGRTARDVKEMVAAALQPNGEDESRKNVLRTISFKGDYPTATTEYLPCRVFNDCDGY